MSRNERFTEPAVIRKRFKKLKANSPGGPIILYDKGTAYIDTSEAHIEVDGRTGTGKSACVSTAYAISCLLAGENLIAVDPKADLRDRTIGIAEKSHNVILFDFRTPRLSKDQWNPLLAPYKNYTSGDPDLRDVACSQVDEMAHSIYPDDKDRDPFWPQSGAEFFEGLIYGLFDKGEPEEINIDSIVRMMEDAPQKYLGTNYISEFASSLDENSLGRRKLASYTNAPSETRGSIHSVAANGISSVFSSSRGLIEMLSRDTIDINNLDMEEKPFAIYIIIPDSESTYDGLAALLISQITQHLIRLAHKKYAGRLPIRTNILLEELSSLGKSLPNLPHLMVASRSRNMRLMLILQSGHSQLETLYGKAQAETINSCVGVTIAFSTNSWSALQEWSQRCGERTVDINGHMVKEPLITAAQLGAMSIGTALIIIENRYKYITKLPFFQQVFDMSVHNKPCLVLDAPSCKEDIKTFDMKEYSRRAHQRKMEQLMGGQEAASIPIPMPRDINRMMQAIDRKIAMLEAEEAKENANYTVVITSFGRGKTRIAAAIKNVMEVTVSEVRAMLDGLPARICVDSQEKAKCIAESVTAAGGSAEIIEED